MTETPPKSPSPGAIAAIIAALPSEVRGILSVLLLFFTFFVMAYALVNMPAYFKNFVSSSSTREQCWELREIQGTIFKFNKCDGSVSQIDAKQSWASASKEPNNGAADPLLPPELTNKAVQAGEVKR